MLFCDFLTEALKTLTDGLRVAAQHVTVFGSLLLNTALHVAERSLHPLSETLLNLLVVLLHLKFQTSMCLLALINSKSQKLNVKMCCEVTVCRIGADDFCTFVCETQSAQVNLELK